MHFIVSYAAPPAGSQRPARLPLPQLQQLLRTWQVAHILDGNEADLSPLHERVQAHACGLDAPNGLIPWAAQAAQQAGLVAPPSHGWAFITPCHWQVETQQVRMHDPDQLHWDTEESQAFLQLMQAYCTDDGITLHHLSPGTWLAHGTAFKALPTASLDRVRGQVIDDWIPRAPQAKALRRLQNEMQMLLYTHPLNDARQARGHSPINSFWISGTGDLPPGHTASTTATRTDHRLRDAAIHNDTTRWQLDWQQLDTTLIAEVLQTAATQPNTRLTLCGAQHAYTLAPQSVGWWQSLRQRWQAPEPTTFLSRL